jgi:hypothetical protein
VDCDNTRAASKTAGERFEYDAVSVSAANNLPQQPLNSAAQSGAFSADSDATGDFADPDLALLIDRWPWLSAAVKSEVLAIIDAAANADAAMPK